MMNTIEDMLKFGDEIDYYDHCYIERVIELHHLQNCLINMLSEEDIVLAANQT